MWRNVYRLSDGSYAFGGPWNSAESARQRRILSNGVVCVGLVHELGERRP